MQKKARWMVLIDLINKHNIKKFAEIGVWKSQTLREILKECKSLQEYWAIDQWGLDPKLNQMSSKEIEAEYWNNLYIYACKLMTWFPPLKVVRMVSSEAAKLFSPYYFDMIFIDANHKFEYVTEDIKLWSPLIRRGGLLTGHDYNSNKHRGVSMAVNKIFNKDIVNVYDSLVWSIEVK